MFDWLFAPQHDRRLLPGGYRGPTPFFIAIMTFAMMIVAAAGLALSNAAGIVAKGIDSRYSIQIPGGGRDLPAVLEAARTAPGVLSVDPVPEAEMRKTLEEWLGPAGGSEDLPVPALVTVDVVDEANLSAISSRVEQAAPGARFVAHEEALEPLLKSVRALQWLALALVALMAGATSAAVVLAARGALDTHRSTIEVMHGIGATDVQVTRLFQRKIALDALAGGLFGGVAAAVVLAILAAGGSALAGDFTGSTPLSTLDLLILASLPVLMILLATGVARAAVLTALRESIPILRLTALIGLFYALGFVLFSVTLGKPVSNKASITDAAVVITGGSGRIEHGVDVVKHGKAERLLVAGADPSVTKADLIRRLGGHKRLVDCCVDLGSESVDTRSNAEEAGRWLSKHRYSSLRLITSDWHMRRARYEFRRVLGRDYKIVADAVRTEPGFLTLFAEYNKYVLRRLAVWLDI